MVIIEGIDPEEDEKVEKEYHKNQGILHKILKKISVFLKSWSFGQYITKFYRKKKAKYSSVSGGIISIFLCVFIFIMVSVSFWNLFQNNDYTMTWGTTTLEKWDLRDITFKELVDLGFPLPNIKYS